jgi:hypothetical protein
MPYAFVHDVAASWHLYERVAAALSDPAPPGLIVHIAGATEDGFRIIAIWEDEQSWDQFRCGPAGAALAMLDSSGRPQPTFRGLRSRHFVVGRSIWTTPLEKEETR